MVLLKSQTKPIGWEAPDFDLLNVDDKRMSLADFADKQGLLVAFTCNHCPYAQAAWPLLVELYEKYGKNVSFVGINPNDEQVYPEDSFQEMKVKAKEWGIEFPYLRDESQEVAKSYNAQCTPDLYLFKNDGGVLKLFYHGRINDNWQQPENVKERNLDDALARLEKGEDPPAEQPPSMGCSIKWK